MRDVMGDVMGDVIAAALLAECGETIKPALAGQDEIGLLVRWGHPRLARIWPGPGRIG
jgi:hypothetical protein